jgi:hypothetical protein
MKEFLILLKRELKSITKEKTIMLLLRFSSDCFLFFNDSGRVWLFMIRIDSENSRQCQLRMVESQRLICVIFWLKTKICST